MAPDINAMADWATDGYKPTGQSAYEIPGKSIITRFFANLVRTRSQQENMCCHSGTPSDSVPFAVSGAVVRKHPLANIFYWN
jgi:hypothetical protein